MPSLIMLDTIAQAARNAGALLRDLPRPAPAASMAAFRASFDAVEAPAATLLATSLAAVRPGVPWAAEMDTFLPPTGERWIVDVLDGAVQYLQDLPHWCVSITLVRDRRAVATVLHSPPLSETYTAAIGFGARRNGLPLSPSTKTDLSHTLVATSQPPFAGTQPDAIEQAGRSLSALLPEVGAVRNLGPTSWQIADTAAGRIDGFWEYGRDDTNLLGAALIASEAGATVTDLNGQPWQAGSDSFLTAAPALHRQLLALLGAGD
jgi:myo-inositol-1(or 4)-monophosphatase